MRPQPLKEQYSNQDVFRKRYILAAKEWAIEEVKKELCFNTDNIERFIEIIEETILLEKGKE